MTNLKKAFLTLFVILIIIPTILLLLFISIVNPNKYKDNLTRLISSQINREITIAGDLDWSLFPLGVSLNKLTIANDPAFKEPYLLKSEQTIVSFKLLPMLTGRYKIKKFTIENTIINLSINKTGNTNWQSLIESQPEAPNSAKQNKEIDSTAQPDKSNRTFKLAIEKLDIINAKINWIQAGQKIVFDDFNISVTNFDLDSAQPLIIDGNINTTFDNSKLTIRNNFNGEIMQKNNFEQALITIKNINTSFRGPGAPSNLKIKTSAIINADNKNQIITIKPLNINVNRNDIQGSNKTNLQPNLPTSQGNLNTKNFEVSNVLNNSPIAGKANVDFNYNTAGLGGNTMTKNLNGDLKFALSSGRLNGVDIDKLLKLVTRKITLEPKDILETVKSTVDLIEGIVKTAVGANQSTEISSLTASAVIKNGVLSSNDLKMTTPVTLLTGSGFVNLPANSIKYALNLTGREDPESFSLPITISGSLSNPSYSVGMPKGELINKALKGLITDNIKKVPGLENLPTEKLEKPLKKLDKILGF